MPPPESGIGRGSASSGDGRLTNQTGDIAGAGENVGEDGGFGAVWLAVPGGTFHTTSPLVGVAAFSVAEAPDTQFPRGRIDFEVAGEADVTVGQGAIDDDGAAKRCVGLLVGTVGRNEGENSLGIRGWIADKDVR